MNDIINICGIDCYEKDCVVYLRLEIVARGLGITDSAKSQEYVKWDRVRKYLNEIGFSTEVSKNTFIPENVFYRLAMKVKNEVAEKFQAKIADEVIPAIRRTSGYAVNEQQFVSTYLPFADNNTKALFSSTLAALQEANAKITADKPKVLFADAVSASTSSILIGDLAKLIRQNGVNVGQNRLFIWLRDNQYLCAKGERYNMPTQRSMELGLFEIKETTIVNSDGSIRVTRTPKVTSKGQQYFINQFLRRKA